MNLDQMSREQLQALKARAQTSQQRAAIDHRINAMRASPGGAFARQAAQGFSRDWMDELAAATGIGESQFNEQRQIEDYQDQPLAASTGDFVGRTLAYTPFGKSVMSMQLLPRTATLGGMGALDASVSAAGAAPAGLGLEAALDPSTLLGGFASGAIIPQAMDIGGRIGRMLFRSPQEEAARRVGQSLVDEGIDATTAQARLAELPEGGMVADVGTGPQRTGQVAMQSLGPEARLAEDALLAREARAGRTVLGIADDAFEPKAANARAWRDMSISDMKQKAAPLYKELDQQSLDAGMFDDLMTRPSMEWAAKNVEKGLAEEGLPGASVNSFRYWNEVKQQLDRYINRLEGKERKTQQFRRAVQTKNELVRRMDEALPSYKDARNIYTGSHAMEHAFEMGEKVGWTRGAGAGWKIDDALAEWANWSQSERAAFKMGLYSNVKSQITSAPKFSRAVENWYTGSMGQEQLLTQVLGPSKFQVFDKMMNGMKMMRRTTDLATRGSQTARNIRGIEEAQTDLAGALSEVLGAVFRGGPLLSRAYNTLGDTISRNRKNAVSNEVVRMLYLSEDLQRDLARAMQAERRARGNRGRLSVPVGAALAGDIQSENIGESYED